MNLKKPNNKKQNSFMLGFQQVRDGAEMLQSRADSESNISIRDTKYKGIATHTSSIETINLENGESNIRLLTPCENNGGPFNKKTYHSRHSPAPGHEPSTSLS